MFYWYVFIVNRKKNKKKHVLFRVVKKLTVLLILAKTLLLCFFFSIQSPTWSSLLNKLNNRGVFGNKNDMESFFSIKVNIGVPDAIVPIFYAIY